MANGGELFSHEEWSDGAPPRVALAAWQVCRQLCDAIPIDAMCRDQAIALARLCPAISRTIRDLFILHNLAEPLLDQFLRRLGDSAVDELLLWSPFWDHRSSALSALVDATQPRCATIASQPDRTSIDPDQLQQVVATYPKVEWRFVELQPGEALGRNANTLIHAKGILVRQVDGHEIVLTGSPKPISASAAGDCANGEPGDRRHRDRSRAGRYPVL
jgi:hypothetical protein